MKFTRTLKIGTRRSKPAMWQTKRICSLLLIGLGRTGVFSKELEDAR